MNQTLPSSRIAVGFLALSACLIAANAATAAPPVVPYNLGALPSGLTVAWPAPPKITRQATVRTAAEFNKAAAIAGTRVTVDAAISQSGTINASDVEVQMTARGSLGGLFIERSIKRVALIGGQYNGTVEMSLPSSFWPSHVDNAAWMVEDVLIDGVSVDSSDTAFFLRGKRVALLHSYAHAREYAIYSDTASGMRNENIIVAGNELVSDGDQATVRLISALTSVAVDNRFTSLMSDGGYKHNYRVHGKTGQSYAARNVLVNAGTMLNSMPNDTADKIWFDSNTFHHKTPDMFNADARIRMLHARNNVAYTNVWKCFSCGKPSAGWDIGNNTVLPYKAPPSL